MNIDFLENQCFKILKIFKRIIKGIKIVDSKRSRKMNSLENIFIINSEQL